MQKPHCSAPVAANALAEPLTLLGRQPLERGDRGALDLRQREVAADDGLAVDQHRAAAALAGRRAAVLGRQDAELLPERGEQMGVLAGDRGLGAVQGEGRQPLKRSRQFNKMSTIGGCHPKRIANARAAAGSPPICQSPTTRP